MKVKGKTFLVVRRGGKDRVYDKPKNYLSAKKDASNWWEVFAKDDLDALNRSKIRGEQGESGKTYGIIVCKADECEDEGEKQILKTGFLATSTKKGKRYTKQQIDELDEDSFVECRVPGCEYRAKCLTNHLLKAHDLKGKEYQAEYGGEVFCKALLNSMRKNGAKGADTPFNEIVQKVRSLSREQQQAVINFIDKVIDRGDWRDKYAEISGGREGLG